MVLFIMADESSPLLTAHPRALVVAGESIFPLGEHIAPPQGSDERRREPHVHPDMLQILLATSGACFCEIDGMRLAGRAPMLITIPGGGVHGFETDGASTGWAATIAHARVLDLVVNRWGARFLGRRFACSVGRGGITTTKREGDGRTPVGTQAGVTA